MTYEKLYNEIYAAVSLAHLWQEYRPAFIKSESPDWINHTMDLGLEVSQALMPQDGQSERFIEQYLGCRREDLPEAAFARYGSRLYFYDDRFWAILPDKNQKEGYLPKTKYRFDRKLEKLNTNYSHFAHNALYLYLHPTGQSRIDTGQLFHYMQRRQNTMAVHFDWVFLDCVHCVYICDFLKKRVETAELSEETEHLLRSRASALRSLGEMPNGACLEELYCVNPEKFKTDNHL